MTMQLKKIACPLWIGVVLASLLSGCGAGPAVPPPTSTPRALEVNRVSFPAADGKELSGILFRGGEEDKGIGVVLAHMGAHGADQTSWISFARSAAEGGFGALTFDFREDRAKLDLDAEGAIEYLQDQGYQQIVCMGASMGGTACLKAAGEEDLAGLVVISSLFTTGAGPSGGALVASSQDLEGLTLPKLFITTEGDRNSVPATIQAMYELAPEPKQLQVFPGAVHGTDIFYSDQADAFRESLLDFLEQLR